MKCVCGYSFTADPDDPELYKNADFDLSRNSKVNPFFERITDIKNIIKGVNLKRLYIECINKILDAKYKLQNYKLLPSLEQKKIVIIFFFIVLIIILIILLILHFSNQAGNEAITI